MLQAVHTAKHLSTAALFTYAHFSQIDCTRFQMTGFFSVPCFFIVCTHFLLVTISLLYLVNTGKKMKTHVIYLSCGIAVWTDSNAFFSLRRDFFPLGHCIHKGISFYVLWYATKRARQRCQIVQTPFSAAARLVLPLAPLTLSAK